MNRITSQLNLLYNTTFIVRSLMNRSLTLVMGKSHQENWKKKKFTRQEILEEYWNNNLKEEIEQYL